MSSRPLVKNALVLLVAGSISRLIGMVYRVVLVRIVGAEALGLFQMITPIYRLAATLATLGVPFALPQVVAARLGQRDRAGAVGARQAGMVLMAGASGVVCLLLIALGPTIARAILTDARAGLALQCLPLLLIPYVAGAGWRAYFEGEQRMLPGAACQVTEGLVRVVTVSVVIAPLLALGLSYGAAGMVLSGALGEAAAWLVLFGWPRGPAWKAPALAARRRAQAARELLLLSGPIMFNQLLNSLMQALNVALIPRRLSVAGLSAYEITTLYGRLAGMALPLLFMPMVAIHPIAHVLVPAIADRLARGGRGLVALLFKSFGATLLIGTVAAIAFFWFPEPLSRTLYGEPELAPMVRALAVAAPFAYIDGISSAALFGLGKSAAVFRNSVIANAVRLVLVYLLAGQPAWGIMGVLWAAVADFGVTAVLNCREIARFFRERGRRQQ
ncbi:MAG TPA: oligosaccharide flippase family protein [Limnochordia bacterium]